MQLHAGYQVVVGCKSVYVLWHNSTVYPRAAFWGTPELRLNYTCLHFLRKRLPAIVIHNVSIGAICMCALWFKQVAVCIVLFGLKQP